MTFPRSQVSGRTKTNRDNTLGFSSLRFITAHKAIPWLVFSFGFPEARGDGQGGYYENSLMSQKSNLRPREGHDDLPKATFIQLGLISGLTSCLLDPAVCVRGRSSGFTEGDGHTERKGANRFRIRQLCTSSAFGGFLPILPFLFSPIIFIRLTYLFSNWKFVPLHPRFLCHPSPSRLATTCLFSVLRSPLLFYLFICFVLGCFLLF